MMSQTELLRRRRTLHRRIRAAVAVRRIESLVSAGDQISTALPEPSV